MAKSEQYSGKELLCDVALVLIIGALVLPATGVLLN